MSPTTNLKQTLGGSEGQHTVSQDILDQSINESLQGFTLRPHPSGDSTEAARYLFGGDPLAANGEIANRGVTNTHPVGVFEIHYDSADGVRFFVGSTDEDHRQTVGERFDGWYSGADIKAADPPSLQNGGGRYFAGGKVTFARDCRYPINAAEGPVGRDQEPYDSLLSEMEEPTDIPLAGDYQVLYQVLFKRAPDDWSEGKPFGRDVAALADSLRESAPQASEQRETERLEAAAETIDWQAGEPGYLVDVRIAVVGHTQSGAEELLASLGSETMSAVIDNPVSGQSSRFDPVDASDLPEFWDTVHQRDVSWGPLKRGRGNAPILDQREMATLCYLPNRTVEADEIDWVRDEDAAGTVPDGVPQFPALVPQGGAVDAPDQPAIVDQQNSNDDSEFGAIATTPSGGEMVCANKKARNRLHAHAEDGTLPLFVGCGVTDRRDVAITRDSLDTHAFLLGGREGRKPALELNTALQLCWAGEQVIYHPANDEAFNQFLRTIPSSRADDLRIISPSPIGGAISGLNYLDVWATRGTDFFDAQVEETCNALFSLAGIDDSLSPDTEDALRGVVAAFMASEKSYTVADLVNVLLYNDVRGEIRAALIEELPALNLEGDALEVDEAFGVLADADAEGKQIAAGFEPLLSTPPVRRLLASREGAVRFGEAIENGDIVVVNPATAPDSDAPSPGRLVFKRLMATIHARNDSADGEPRTCHFVCANLEPKFEGTKELEPLFWGRSRPDIQCVFGVDNPLEVSAETYSMFVGKYGAVVATPDLGDREASLIHDINAADPAAMANTPLNQGWATVYNPREERFCETINVELMPRYPPVRTDSEAEELLSNRLALDGIPLPPTASEHETMIRQTGGITDFVLGSHDAEGRKKPLDRHQSLSQYLGRDSE